MVARDLGLCVSVVSGGLDPAPLVAADAVPGAVAAAETAAGTERTVALRGGDEPVPGTPTTIFASHAAVFAVSSGCQRRS